VSILLALPMSWRSIRPRHPVRQPARGRLVAILLNVTLMPRRT